MQLRGLDDHNQRAIQNRDINTKIIRQMSVTKCQASVRYHGCPRDLPLRRTSVTRVARERRHGRLSLPSLGDIPSVVWRGSQHRASDMDAASSMAEETDVSETEPETRSRNRTAKYSVRTFISCVSCRRDRKVFQSCGEAIRIGLERFQEQRYSEALDAFNASLELPGKNRGRICPCCQRGGFQARADFVTPDRRRNSADRVRVKNRRRCTTSSAAMGSLEKWTAP